MNCPKCNSPVIIEEIGYYNGTNEEGEEYGVVEYTCSNCGKDYETSQWGNFDNRDEAIELLKDYIEEL